MSATDELRRLLDERGVEWERGLPTETIVREPIDTLYVECPDGRLHVYFRSYLTPEQAIEATLGRGTCELETNTDMTVIQCSKCGYVVPKGTDLMGVRYCAGCGRKVVNE